MAFFCSKTTHFPTVTIQGQQNDTVILRIAMLVVEAVNCISGGISEIGSCEIEEPCTSQMPGRLWCHIHSLFRQ